MIDGYEITSVATCIVCHGRGFKDITSSELSLKIFKSPPKNHASEVCEMCKGIGITKSKIIVNNLG